MLQVESIAGRTCTVAAAQGWCSSERGLLRIPLGPSWQLLARHHLEARVTAKDLVEELRQALLIALDLIVLPMVELRETQPLVGVEDHCRRQHNGLEERLVLGLNGKVHPHPLHLRTT